MNKTVESLGVGLLRVLCYSYGGFLLVVCAACFSPAQTRALIDALHPSLAVLAIIVVGAAIHVLHRTIVILRQSDFFPNKESLNVAHAENGLLVMSGVGLLIAAGYALSQGKPFALSGALLFLAIIFLAASFWAEWIQHSVECSILKEHPVEAMKILARTGILRTEDIHATMELQGLSDDDVPGGPHEDGNPRERTPDLDLA